MNPIDDELLLSIEAGLRATARDLAQAVPDDTISPLPPPSRQPDRQVARPSLGRRIRQLFAPLTAATAVVAAVVSPPAIAHGMALIATARPVAGQASTSLIPPYYVLVRKTGPGIRHGGDALIMSTASGRTLAVVPARPTCAFVSVTGAASDRAFVLAGQDPVDGFSCLFLLTFTAGKNGQITKHVKPLNVAFTPGSSLFALSPDGTKLSLAQSPGMGLTVVTLATGASRTWITDNSWWSALSWHPGGQMIQYCRRNYSSQTYLCGALKINAAKTPKPSGPERPLAFPGQQIIGMTPDGAVLSYRYNRSITEFSLYPLRLAENLGRIAQATALLWGTAGVLWTNSTGSAVIVSISPGSSSPPAPVELAGSQYRPLPGNFVSASSIAW